jgi:ribosome maturation factor RimP
VRHEGLGVSLQQIVEETVTGLGYDLIEIERSGAGLLRVTIDWPWQIDAPQERLVNVQDCERVTRQLQYALEVASVDYRRLEVSSPGIDRVLRHDKDFQRFVGECIDITLRQPMGAAAAGLVSANRKKFRGQLQCVTEQASMQQEEILAGGTTAPTQWQLVWRDEEPVKPGQRVSKKREPKPLQVLVFSLDELRDARLAPLVDFKGRPPKGQSAQDGGTEGE